jgi:hypothetical protein
MPKDLFAFVVSSVTSLIPAPERAADIELIAKPLTQVLESEAPIFADDEDKTKTASTVIAVAFREGSLKLRVVGDCTLSKPGQPCKGRPRSFCTMQIHETSGGTAALNDDIAACFRKGLSMLRTSVKTCPKHPVAWYAAGGIQACENLRAQKISFDRMFIAKKLQAKGKTDERREEEGTGRTSSKNSSTP